MVYHWLPEGYVFVSDLILLFVVGTQELWRRIRMLVAPARKEETQVYFFPQTRAVEYLGNRAWKVCGNRGTLAKIFFKMQWNFQWLIIY